MCDKALKMLVILSVMFVQSKICSQRLSQQWGTAEAEI